MSDYTLTTEEVRYHWTFYEGDRSEAAEQFDRWFASEIEKAERRGVDRLEDELVRQDCFSDRTLRIADSVRDTVQYADPEEVRKVAAKIVSENPELLKRLAETNPDFFKEIL